MIATAPSSLAGGTFSVWPLWGGTWKWTARARGSGASGTAPTRDAATGRAVEALAQLNRERQAKRP